MKNEAKTKERGWTRKKIYSDYAFREHQFCNRHCFKCLYIFTYLTLTATP